MANESPVTTNSLPQHHFPTPSPFSFSVASTRWSSRPPIHRSTLVLRFLAFISSFISAFSWAASSSQRNGGVSSSFNEYPEFLYSFVITTIAFIYTALQLVKGVLDIVYTGILISDEISEYISFALDQLVAYLLVSSSSAAIPVIHQLEHKAIHWKGAVLSISMSFAAFLSFAICTLMSGHKLCKRIIW